MTGFVPETVWLNKLVVCGDGKPPLIWLVGNKLTIREPDYWNPEEFITDFQDVTKLGSSCSKQKIGKTKMKQLGMRKAPTIGILPNNNFNLRSTNILGEEKGKIFGKNNIQQIGITKSNSNPPRAVLVPSARLFMITPKNYWKQTLASQVYKKITGTCKKYFFEAK